MDEPTAGPPAWFEWNGLKWYRNAKDGYYRDSSGGVLLHVAVWVHHHGRLPNGYEVHHLDHDRSNNASTNLDSGSLSDHRAYHTQRRVTEDKTWAAQLTTEAARARANKLWAEREPRPFPCANCGAIFQTRGMRPMYCRPACAAAARRARRRAEMGTYPNV